MTDTIERLKTTLADRYAIEEELGAGGMATVYLAHDIKHDRKVAIKVLRPELAAVIGPERFLREIKLAANLNHPHILGLHDSGSAGDALFYVMPFVEGESLREKLNREKQLAVDEAVRIAERVAAALDYAHRRGVVHRDIKPENVLMHEGEAVVADFGIALAVKEAGGARLTETGLSLGTPHYMSPEQATGDRDVDGRTDIYALGAVLYELLTGEPPFNGATAQAIIARALTERPTPPRTLRDTVPEAVERATLKALARSAADRFATAAAFGEALHAEDPGPGDGAEKSIAVLPFSNMSGSPDDEYFTDGITEEIINALSQLPDLRVAARTSSFAFKETRGDLSVVASKLKVGYVVEGSVRRAGNRIRITAQLVNVRDGGNEWSEKYDREMDDIFAVQDEIAGAIAGRLEVELAGRASGPLVKRGTQNLDAYDLYLKGRATLYRRGLALLEGRRLFEQALELDPDYALALAGIADANLLLDFYGLRKSRRRLEDTAARALALDPNVAEVHTSVGSNRIFYSYDWEGGEASYLRALEINPNSVQALCWYGGCVLSSARGDVAGGVAMLERAVELDPLAAYPRGILAWVLNQGRRYEDAERVAAEAIDLDRASLVPVLMRAIALSRCGRVDEAVEVAENAVLAFGRTSWAVAILAQAYARSGDRARANAVCDELNARAAYAFVPALFMATAFAAAERMDDALAVLEQGREDGDPTMFGLRLLEPDSFWGDPRFADLCRSIGIERFGEGMR